ncbi:hypothetical protein GCM10023156_50410 [Novipirellula rosea]|uniref:Uncharacterized protein n=2 Tax=Novipirellula rosea TaxID=1031540 RepID=A0ABP8NDU7_9BACT
MDPTSTFNAMLEAYASNEREEAREHASNLLRWLQKGGFPPRVFLSPEVQIAMELSPEFAEQASAEVCRKILCDDDFDPNEGGEDFDPEPPGPCHPSELIRSECDLP